MHAVRGFRRFLPVVVIGAALLAAPGTALADCQMAPPFEEAAKTAEIVFVGTVTSLANEGRVATVHVDEVWRGGEVPAEVTVFGGTDPAGPMEDDRTFEAGVRYVFFPFVAEGRMVDNICTATTPWVEDFAALRPAGAQTAAPSAAPAATGPLAAIAELALPILTALLIGGAALAVAIVVGRRRDA